MLPNLYKIAENMQIRQIFGPQYFEQNISIGGVIIGKLNMF
jgi:hypothetical protein